MPLLCQSLTLYMDSRSKSVILIFSPMWYRGKPRDSGVSPGFKSSLDTY